MSPCALEKIIRNPGYFLLWHRQVMQTTQAPDLLPWAPPPTTGKTQAALLSLLAQATLGLLEAPTLLSPETSST